MMKKLLCTIACVCATADCISCFAGGVFEKDGCLYLAEPDVTTLQITFGGRDRAPVTNPSDKQVVFIRKSDQQAHPQIGSPEDTGDPSELLADQLWLYDVEQSRERLLVREVESDAEDITEHIQQTVQVIDGDSLCFSTDGKTVYFIAGAWVTSGALHAVDVQSGKRRYLSSALYVEVIPSGEYQDDLIVQQHRYFPGGGSYDWYWRYSPDGEELGVIADDDERLQAFRELHYPDRK